MKPINDIHMIKYSDPERQALLDEYRWGAEARGRETHAALIKAQELPSNYERKTPQNEMAQTLIPTLEKIQAITSSLPKYRSNELATLLTRLANITAIHPELLPEIRDGLGSLKRW